MFLLDLMVCILFLLKFHVFGAFLIKYGSSGIETVLFMNCNSPIIKNFKNFLL